MTKREWLCRDCGKWVSIEHYAHDHLVVNWPSVPLSQCNPLALATTRVERYTRRSDDEVRIAIDPSDKKAGKE